MGGYNGGAGGRPTIYTPELAALICERVSVCVIGLEALCKQYDDMPSHDTIYQWRHKYKQFSEDYLTARLNQAHLLAEQTKDISEETLNYIYTDPRSGAECVDSGIVAMQKMRISSNTWLAARILPKNYGDKQHTEHTISDSTKEVIDRVVDINKECEKEC